MSGKKKEQFH